MEKFLTDVHNHSAHSHDGKASLSEMLEAAQKKGVMFYGVSEHFDYDVTKVRPETKKLFGIDEEAYFHDARHLQEDYAGVLNVLVGAEFSFSYDKGAENSYLETYEKYRPDFIVNSVHTHQSYDYYYTSKEEKRPKQVVYREYLNNVRSSLEVPYPYDIVGHMGYITRYACYEDKRMTLEEFGKEIDDILLTIIKKDKILEINSSNKSGVSRFLPSDEIIERYYELGGRKVSYGSDAHAPDRILDKREDVVALLKRIGFTYITVPCKGEHIKVKI